MSRDLSTQRRHQAKGYTMWRQQQRRRRRLQ
jgi:hypothetical protein